MLMGSFFLGLCYALLLLLLGKGENPYKLLVYGIFLACLLDSRDALLFSYPLILALVVYRLTLPETRSIKLHLAKKYEYAFTLLFAPLGLLPLIKGSLLPICAITLVLCIAILWSRREKALLCLVAGVPVVSCYLFWFFSGQPVLALLGFFISSRQFISGYTEAMSFPGDISECVLYALASALIIHAIAWKARGPKSSTWFLCGSYGVFLFIAFKAGFVRHDAWHNITSGSAILAAALLLLFVVDEKPSLLLPLGVALLAWAYIGHGTMPTAMEDISANLRTTFERSFQGARARLTQKTEFQKRYDQHIAAIRGAFPIPATSETMDIYSFNQSWLLASGNAWSPRPVTQSYSAYTPDLAEMNLRHLQGPSAPDNILFRVEPIDGRLPSLEDGLSWPELINGYSLQKLERDSAFLRKRTAIVEDADGAEKEFSSALHQFGEEVMLPDSDEPLFARIEIEPTFLGKVASALFKPPELRMAVRTREGKPVDYRVISTMMQTNFLLSPLVRSTEEFALLAAGGSKYLTPNEVKSIAISADDGKGLFWNKSYSMKLLKVNLAKNSEAENSILFDQIDDAATPNHLNVHPETCEGSIEAINGTSPHFEIPAIGNVLSIRGWMAISGKDGIVPDHVFVTLTNQRGATLYVRTRSTPREDIRGHFNQPSMPDPGFAAIIDVSSLTGKYTLSLARTYKGTFGTCEQYKLPIMISR